MNTIQFYSSPGMGLMIPHPSGCPTQFKRPSGSTYWSNSAVPVTPDDAAERISLMKEWALASPIDRWFAMEEVAHLEAWLYGWEYSGRWDNHLQVAMSNQAS